MHFSKSSRYLQTSFVGLVVFGIDFSSLICHYPLQKRQRSVLQTCLLYALLYWCRVVNDQVFPTIYLFGITTSMDALWQLSCTPPLQVLLRDNFENFLAKWRNTDSSQILAFSLPPPSWYLFTFFLASNRKKDCSGIIFVSLYFDGGKRIFTSGSSWHIQS